MSCTPFLDKARSSLSPLLSMNITSFRSTVHLWLVGVLCCLQHDRNSRTHGPTNLPCRIQRVSVSVSVMVIFSTAASMASYDFGLQVHLHLQFNGNGSAIQGVSIRWMPTTNSLEGL